MAQQQSNWFLLSQAVAERLRLVAEADNVKLLVHPALPLDLGVLNGDPARRALVLLHRGDRAIEQPGQRNERRTMRVVIGAVALDREGLASADALHFAARAALREQATWDAFRAVCQVGPWKEVEIEPELKDMAVEGHVLFSAIEVPYTQTYPNAA